MIESALMVDVAPTQVNRSVAQQTTNEQRLRKRVPELGRHQIVRLYDRRRQLASGVKQPALLAGRGLELREKRVKVAELGARIAQTHGESTAPTMGAAPGLRGLFVGVNSQATSKRPTTAHRWAANRSRGSLG